MDGVRRNDTQTTVISGSHHRTENSTISIVRVGRPDLSSKWIFLLRRDHLERPSERSRATSVATRIQSWPEVHRAKIESSRAQIQHNGSGPAVQESHDLLLTM